VTGPPDNIGARFIRAVLANNQRFDRLITGGGVACYGFSLENPRLAVENKGQDAKAITMRNSVTHKTA
jgi:hypothetical protein